MSRTPVSIPDPNLLNWHALPTDVDDNVPGPLWKVLTTDPVTGANTYLIHLPGGRWIRYVLAPVTGSVVSTFQSGPGTLSSTSVGSACQLSRFGSGIETGVRDMAAFQSSRESWTRSGW